MVKSPLTGTNDVNLIKEINVDKIIQEYKLKYEIDVSEEFQNVHTIFQYRCIPSRLEFFMPLSVAGSDNIYRKLERFDWYYMKEKWEYEMAICDLQRSGKILEVGCGKGAFLEQLLKLGKYEVLGIELNSRAISYAYNRGLPVINADIGELEVSDKFNAICLFQVLEHLSEPGKFIEKVISRLKPGGRLIFSVPNAESFLKDSKFNILDLPPHHMSRWSIKTIKFLQNIFPVKIVRIRKEPLAQYHAKWFSLLKFAKLPKLFKKKIAYDKSQYLLGKALYHSSFLRKRITGHTIYACLLKLDA